MIFEVSILESDIAYTASNFFLCGFLDVFIRLVGTNLTVDTCDLSLNFVISLFAVSSVLYVPNSDPNFAKSTKLTLSSKLSSKRYVWEPYAYARLSIDFFWLLSTASCFVAMFLAVLTSYEFFALA